MNPEAFDMHYHPAARSGWNQTPKPGELEYLDGKQPSRVRARARAPARQPVDLTRIKR